MVVQTIFTKKFQSPFIFTLILVAILGIFSFIFIPKLQDNFLEIQKIYLTRPVINLEELIEIRLGFVGDIMLDRGVESVIKNYGGGDFKFPFLKIADYLRNFDILFGNLEGPISDKGQDVGSTYSFRQDPKVLEGLKFAGFDVLSLANNHIFDWGRLAMEDTLTKLKESQIEYVGAGFSKEEAFSPKIIEKKGTKIAFLAFSDLGEKSWEAKENSSGIVFLNKENLEKTIKDAKNKADIIVVSMHFGDEYKSQPNAQQKYFAKLAVDLGANLVIGHHPHVVQPIEKYKNSYIAYSLGNFIFDQNFSEETMRSLLLGVVIKNNEIVELIEKDIKINNFFQPEIAI